MSKAGAVASKVTADFLSAIAAAGSKGIRAAALEIWEADEAEKVEKTKRALTRLVAQRIGIEHDEPFVLEDERYASRFAPHQRVCVEIDGTTINYLAARGRDGEELRLIIGRCVGCGCAPLGVTVGRFADLAKADLPHLEYLRKNFRCGDCTPDDD